MKILGIQDSHDAGAAIIGNGKIVAAINEERLNRMKMCWGFPRRSISKALEIAKLEPKDIDLIAIAGFRGIWEPKIISHKQASEKMSLGMHKKASLMGKTAGNFMNTQAWIPLQRAIEAKITIKRREKAGQYLKAIGFECPVKFVDHHMAHAASAYYTGGKDRATVVTSDATGDCLSSVVCTGEKGELKLRQWLGNFNSIGKYYSYVTKICGFTPNRHEGKITGLAAFGKPVYINYFNSQISYEDGRIVNKSKSRHSSAIAKIKKDLGHVSKEDLSASIQLHIEQNLRKYVDYWVEKTGFPDVVTAGGVFANVKLNQRIAESPLVKSFFVHPHMGDGGLSAGAALYELAEHKLNQGSMLKPKKLDNVYFGPKFGPEEIQMALARYKLRAKESSNVAAEAAGFIAKKKIVGFFQGRMEYGPRALGNRSILADPTDKKINTWLNNRLSRTEFMPFAPSILDTDAKSFYKNYGQSTYPAKFMTITFDVPKAKEKKAEAVVHIDHTARPQVVDKKTNETYYKTLKAYKEITGLPLFVNTSFNAHEEPIVCTPDDAIRSFKNGAVDVLVLENFIVSK